MAAMKKIVILGGGTAGWVSAAALARNAAKNGYEVIIVDTAEIPTIGVGEASIPTIYDLLRHTGIDDSQVIEKGEATFKYGIQFEGWSHPGEAYMHGFGNMGTNFGETEFFSAWLSGARYFTSRDLAPFIPAVTAAKKGKFARVAVRPENAAEHMFFPLCELSYALHFDASLLARLLREKALLDGAVHIRKQIGDVETNAGGITALLSDDGERIEGDLFVDCSGLYGFLARKTLEGEFEDWRAYLPCDNAIAVQSARDSAPNLYTRSVAHSAGWRWEIQLQGRTGNGSVYCSDFISEDEATDRLLKEIEGEPITEPRKIAFKTGRMPHPWHKNCVAIGLSAGFLEPLESTSIHLICKYAIQLEAALASKQDAERAREKFNSDWCEETSEIRDFLMAHYVVNQRDEPFWKARRDGPKPESLKRYLSQFSEEGWITLPGHALFGNDSWYQVLIGQGYPLNFDKFACPQENAPQVINFLQNVAQAVHLETDKIPHSHVDVIGDLKRKAAR